MGAGDEGGLIGEQEQRGMGDIARLAQAALLGGNRCLGGIHTQRGQLLDFAPATSIGVA